MKRVTILGAGLAGCEAALQLAARGIAVTLIEAKPEKIEPAVYRQDGPAELVCSNSLKSESNATPSYQLKAECRIAGSFLLRAAEEAKVAAGESLAVDREIFSRAVAALIEHERGVTIVRGAVVASLDDLRARFPADLHIVATGPLTSPELLASISSDNHYFYDAIAPIVSAEGLDLSKLFWADRYEKGQPDFLNCPLSRQEYERFVDALLAADKLPYADHERPQFFDRCMPIETMAERGRDTLSFGPFRPVGFEVEGKRPYAVVQLRAENAEKSAFNLVGCQTRMRHHAQREVFRLLPGIENAEFLRFGSVHRNSYINAPELLADGLNLLKHPDTYVAGQLSGVEGYNESIWSGLYTALAILARFDGKELPPPPAATMSGGLLRKLRAPAGRFAPVNANFSIIDNPTRLRKRDRKLFHVADGIRQFGEWWDGLEKGTKAT